MGRKGISNAEYMRAYYLANKDRWKKRSPEKQAAHNAKRRAKYAADEAFRQECCEQAKEYRRKHPKRRRLTSIRTSYGLTEQQYYAMLDGQGGACAICCRAFVRTPHVDHCHQSGAVRGLLCDDCNLGLGKFRDDARALHRAAAYLRTAHKKTKPTKQPSGRTLFSHEEVPT